MRRGTLIALSLTAGTAVLLAVSRRKAEPKNGKGGKDVLDVGGGGIRACEPLAQRLQEANALERPKAILNSLQKQLENCIAAGGPPAAAKPEEITPIKRARELLTKLKRDILSVTQDEVNEMRGLVPLIRQGYEYEATSIETLLRVRDSALSGDFQGPIVQNPIQCLDGLPPGPDGTCFRYDERYRQRPQGK